MIISIKKLLISSLLLSIGIFACTPGSKNTNEALGTQKVTPATSAKVQEPPPVPAIVTAYQEVANQIIQKTLEQNEAYAKLAELCDTIGNRLSGSESLNKAIDWAVRVMKEDGQENVRKETVMVRHWVRGKESLTLVEPRETPMVMLGLGGSVGTPKEGIEAEVVVVSDEAELDALGEKVRGKIVLFNNPMPQYDPEKGAGYGKTVRFRTNGARLASEKGAVATLVRSVTAKSLQTPHTGAMRYGDAAQKIPAAAVSVEDAELLARLVKRKERVIVRLKMEAHDQPEAESANVLAELVGTTLPEEIVVIGGHIDSWDVGQGAHDDGAGCVIAMEALAMLRKLGLRPKRTIRVVLFTNEENGLAGGVQYAVDHAQELSKHAAAIESDSGGFMPLGMRVEFKDKEKQERAAKQLKDIMQLLAPINANQAIGGFSGADLIPMESAGVPRLGLWVDGSKYFDYHHTDADTLDKVDPEELSRGVVTMAVVAYVLADMPGRLGD